MVVKAVTSPFLRIHSWTATSGDGRINSEMTLVSRTRTPHPKSIERCRSDRARDIEFDTATSLDR